jgi:hypothetical protein
MRPEEFKSLFQVRPFVPLRIHMTDGRAYDIKHPDQVFIARTTFDVGVEPDPNGIFDRMEFGSLLHIVRVERISTPSSANSS